MCLTLRHDRRRFRTIHRHRGGASRLRDSLPALRYSSRSTSMGSTLDARAAGSSDAAVDTAITSAITPLMVITSQGDTPNTILASTLVNAAPRPSPRHTAQQRHAHALPQELLHDLPAQRPQREPQPDFALPDFHQVAQRAV